MIQFLSRALESDVGVIELDERSGCGVDCDVSVLICMVLLFRLVEN